MCRHSYRLLTVCVQVFRQAAQSDIVKNAHLVNGVRDAWPLLAYACCNDWTVATPRHVYRGVSPSISSTCRCCHLPWTHTSGLRTRDWHRRHSNMAACAHVPPLPAIQLRSALRRVPCGAEPLAHSQGYLARVWSNRPQHHSRSPCYHLLWFGGEKRWTRWCQLPRLAMRSACGWMLTRRSLR